MSLTMEYTETLIVTHCWCGIACAVPENLFTYTKRHKGKAIFCPRGHEFIFGNTVEEQLADEKRRHAATRDLLRTEERSHQATRGHLTRQRKRAAAGVCPCCHRSFQNVQRHVQVKHPDFNPEAMPDAGPDH